jgi:hypothetical protein
MTSIRTISPQKTLKDAVIMMDSINVFQLPVADNGVILGSITKKSIPLLIKNGVKNIESQPIEISWSLHPPYSRQFRYKSHKHITRIQRGSDSSQLRKCQVLLPRVI